MGVLSKVGSDFLDKHHHPVIQMLIQNQQKYLATIPEDKIVHIRPYDSKVKDVGNSIVLKIKEAIPGLDVLFMGASALGIGGQNDIDLNILSVPAEYSKYIPVLEKLFGKPAKTNPNLVKWEFVQDGFEVELYLTDKNSPALLEQIKTFEILRDNQNLAKEYENIKLECNGLSFREYMRRKYEFFNKILKLDDGE